jgi:GPI mannosyltransferase 3
LLMLGVFSAWFFYPTHLLTWISALFFLIHSLLGHKEQRFLYPLLSGVPILFVLGLRGWFEFFAQNPTLQRLPEKSKFFLTKMARPIQVLLYGLLLYDVGALLISSLKPSTNQPKFYEAVFNQGPHIQELYYSGMNPYELGNVEVNFYRRPELKLRRVPALADLEGVLGVKTIKSQTGTPQSLWFFYDQDRLPEELHQLKERCQLVYSVFPRWLNAFSFLPGPARFACRWSLFQCE